MAVEGGEDRGQKTEDRKYPSTYPLPEGEGQLVIPNLFRDSSMGDPDLSQDDDKLYLSFVLTNPIFQ